MTGSKLASRSRGTSIDAIHVKVRDGQVTNRPFYVVIGVTVDGHRDVLGIWAGDGGEGAKTSHVP